MRTGRLGALLLMLAFALWAVGSVLSALVDVQAAIR